MRSVAGALLTAQQSASNEPHVDVNIDNALQYIRRLDQALLNSTNHGVGGKHDVAVAANGNVIRIRSDNFGGILTQTVNTPGTGSAYAASYTSQATGRGNLVACAAAGARVLIVYNNAAGTTIHWKESTDSGATWGLEQTMGGGALGSVPADLACAYKNATGDFIIAWVRSTSTVGVKRRDAGAFGANAETAIGSATLNGIACAYNFDYQMLLTGTETTTLAPTVWSWSWGDGAEVTLNTADTIRVQHQAEADASIAYTDPSMAMLDATIRYLFQDAGTFVGGTTRVYRSWVHPNVSFRGAAFTHRAPVPVDYSPASAKGLACATEGSSGYMYETAPDIVYRAPCSLVRTNVANDVVALDIHERSESLSGWLDLDNSSGQYAGPPSWLQIGNFIEIRPGYNSPSGTVHSTMPDMWIRAYEYRRTGGRSVLRLELVGGWEILDNVHQHGQLIHTGVSYLTILGRIFARAGLVMSNTSASSRVSSVSPASFVIAADTSAKTSVLRVLQFLSDRLRWKQNAEANLTNPSSAAATDYTFGVAHPLNEVSLRTQLAPVSEQLVVGAAAWGESFDYASAGQGLALREILRDQNSATGATANATAADVIRRRALDAPAGRLVAPPNVGQEILDLVDFTDTYIRPSANKRRVQGIRWRYDRHAALYEQTLTLGAG